MEPKRRREIALAVVAAMIVVVAVMRIRSMAGGSEAVVRSQPASTATFSQQQANQKGLIAEVDLGSLKTLRPEPVDATRNPFGFKPKPPPPPPPSPVRPGGPSTAASAEPPPPPRISLKFIGILDSPKTGRVAVLSDTRGVYYGHDGETIEGRYRIVKIGVESIDLAYLDGRGRQTIRLTGQ